MVQRKKEEQRYQKFRGIIIETKGKSAENCRIIREQ